MSLTVGTAASRQKVIFLSLSEWTLATAFPASLSFAQRLKERGVRCPLKGPLVRKPVPHKRLINGSKRCWWRQLTGTGISRPATKLEQFWPNAFVCVEPLQQRCTCVNFYEHWIQCSMSTERRICELMVATKLVYVCAKNLLHLWLLVTSWWSRALSVY